ncbi:TRAP transporter permease [Halorubrum vacuolatum]|uniref:TRAP transporter, 4TM/12TM fusion protein n=1 Tax=Halorubrum vacuolatum TaxID=63740 RepID=A0A238UV26_HALVU|nr:TRAP transporter fused permease subunit [Halorubrum vacuolatum]SNR25587.1 TRAP transporter, 4TM/12TM fusion protein [Halorubrum vacuolatum]
MATDSGSEHDPTDGIDEDLTKHDVEPELADRPIGEVARERLAWSALKERATMNSVLGVLSIPFWAYVMYMSLGGASRAMFGIGFLGGILLLYIHSELADNVGGGTNYIVDDLKTLLSEHRSDVAILSVCAVITVITTVYMFTNVLRLVEGGRVTTPELVMAAAFSLVMIYLTWRAFGITFLAVVLVGIGYGLFGWIIPGTLGHTGISVNRTLRILALANDGFFGFLTQLTAAWIALFLLYAGMLRAYGAFDLILRAAVRAAKYVDSGVAQTAVIASAVIGSVNGSQTANAGMTGSFTIPMMKESGVRGSTAGGIESVASTTGQVLPPVMGAGAFVMASLITGISYLDVIVAGLIPAGIMMVVVAVAVHYAAAPQIEDPEMTGQFDYRLTQGELALEGIKFGVPLFVLIYLLGFLGYTVMTSAFVTVVTMAFFGITIPTGKAAFDTRDARVTFWQFVDTLQQTFNGLRGGVVVLAPVAIILGAINGVVDILQATGVPTAVSLTLMSLSGGVLIIAAVMAMGICILLGLGMPTTAAYTVVALLVAPTLINQFFLPEFSAHFFVFYAAILAGLTPPIATCVAVACSIAGSDFWETCFEAVKISAPLFILPFSFIYHPGIVDHGGEFTTSVLLTSAIILAGSLIIIHGLNYRFDLGRAPALGLRAVFFSLGVTIMVFPDQMVQLGALGVATFLYLTQAAVGQSSPLDRLRSIAR